MIAWDKRLLTSWDLAVATNYSDSKIFQTLSSWNLVATKNLLEQYAYTSIGFIQDFKTTVLLEDVNAITVDNCNVGDVDIYARKTSKFSFNRVDMNNIPMFAQIFWMSTVAVAGTSAPTTQTVSAGDWAKNVQITFGTPNANGSAPTITSITGSITGALTAGSTGYQTSTDWLGRPGITIQTWFLGSIAQDIVMVYTSTPNAHEITGFNDDVASLPMSLYRFRSCKQDNGPGVVNPALRLKTRNTVYLAKFYLDSEVVNSFVNRKRQQFEWTSLEFQSADGWLYILVKETFEEA